MIRQRSCSGRWFLLLFVATVFSGLNYLSLQAQTDRCLTFDDPRVPYCDNWQGIAWKGCAVIANPPAGHSSAALQFIDGSGGSYVWNTADFAGNWLERAVDGCLCFDYMVDLQYPWSPKPQWTAPRVFLFAGSSWLNSTIRARLVSLPGAPTMQEDVWYHICLPVDSCRNGQLPSNAQFTWRIVQAPPGMDSCTAWNTLITNVGGLALGLDYHSSPSERIYFDNFCWGCDSPQRCPLHFEVAQQDTACCTFEWILVQSTTSAIQQVQYSVSGGTMDTLIASGTPFCTYTTFPSSLYGTVSGNLQFTPPCGSSPLTLFGEITPNTASGKVEVILTVTLADGQVCFDTLQMQCQRPPITRCDSLKVEPFIWPGLNLSGRTFTIFNQKQPPSPICRVEIELIPDPNPGNATFKWNGGGLVIDGSSRSWGVANSGLPYYSVINCSGGGAPQGAPANATIQFNLGVDYTLDWIGSVVLRVIHCDGDTCVVAYENWCAKQQPWECIRIVDIDIDRALHDTLISGRTVRGFGIVIDSMVLSGKATGGVKPAYVVGELLEKDWHFIAVGIDDHVGDKAARKMCQWEGQVKMVDPDRRWCLIDLSTQCPAGGSDYRRWMIQGFVQGIAEKLDPPIIRITVYDEESNPLLVDSVIARSTITSVEDEGVQQIGRMFPVIRVVPNPADDEVEMWLDLGRWNEVTVAICDLEGHCYGERTIRGGGKQRIAWSVEHLPSGRYHIRLQYPAGVVVQPLTITR